ncbi:MAG: hypothetical protein VKJ27_02700 [Synechocystis sp.]|nr:hypothetical protein [Synechocystis sp.]
MDDTTVGSTPDVTTNLAIAITDVVDTVLALTLSIQDSSGDADDRSIQFNTALSQFRATTDSLLVRHRYADSQQYIDLSNSGQDGTLTITGIDVQASDVSLSHDFSVEGDILLNPGETHRINLNYAPSEANQTFNVADGLVIYSNAHNNAITTVALAGQSTYQSDINYDGVVSFGDLGPLIAEWSKAIA